MSPIEETVRVFCHPGEGITAEAVCRAQQGAGFVAFILYDVETTGLNRRFDQILQFAAIRTDADLSETRRTRLEGMHLTRLGEANDVANAAVYLASRESEFVTGVNLALDGGGSAARGLTLG